MVGSDSFEFGFLWVRKGSSLQRSAAELREASVSKVTGTGNIKTKKLKSDTTQKLEKFTGH